MSKEFYIILHRNTTLWIGQTCISKNMFPNSLRINIKKEKNVQIKNFLKF